MRTFHRVLAATDFSDGGMRALDLAAQVAAACGVPLVVLHAFQTTVVFDEAGPWPTREADPGPQLALLESRLAECRTRARKRHARLVDVALVKGEPAETILRFARDHECDLIVVGPDGVAPVADQLGSVAEKVVRSARCPVLVAGRA